MQYYTYIILVATLVRGCWRLLQAKFLCSWGVPFLRLVHPPCLTPDIKPPPLLAASCGRKVSKTWNAWLRAVKDIAQAMTLRHALNGQPMSRLLARALSLNLGKISHRLMLKKPVTETSQVLSLFSPSCDLFLPGGVAPVGWSIWECAREVCLQLQLILG
jgi:hypothetical protein